MLEGAEEAALLKKDFKKNICVKTTRAKHFPGWMTRGDKYSSKPILAELLDSIIRVIALVKRAAEEANGIFDH